MTDQTAGTDELDLDTREPEDEQGKQETKHVKALLTEYKTARQFDIGSRRLYQRDRNVASGRSAKN